MGRSRSATPSAAVLAFSSLSPAIEPDASMTSARWTGGAGLARLPAARPKRRDKVANGIAFDPGEGAVGGDSEGKTFSHGRLLQ